MLNLNIKLIYNLKILKVNSILKAKENFIEFKVLNQDLLGL